MLSRGERRSIIVLTGFLAILLVCWLAVEIFDSWPGKTAVLCALAVAGAIITRSALNTRNRSAFTVECPRCRREALRELARNPHYYECVECRARLHLPAGSVLWLDASGPEAEEYFRPSSDAGQWTGYAVPQPDKSTVGSLLRNKWDRSGTPPPKPVDSSPPTTSHDPMRDPWIDE